jgi:tetratricopeptide (TPR) repeat protein
MYQVAQTCINLAAIYGEMGNIDSVIRVYEETLATFQMLGNQREIGLIHQNLGADLHIAGRLFEAIEHYEASLAIFQKSDLPRRETQVHYNLAEAHAAVDQAEKARWHWWQGYALGQEFGLTGQLEWFDDLRAKTPALQSADTGAYVKDRGRKVDEEPDAAKEAASHLGLLPDEQKALSIVWQEGHVNVKVLMAQLDIAKSTATRKLTKLVERGFLKRIGKGRATCYVVPENGGDSG